MRHHRPRLDATASARGLRVRLRAGHLLEPRRAGSVRLRRRHRLRPGRGAEVRRRRSRPESLRCESAESASRAAMSRSGHGFSISPAGVSAILSSIGTTAWAIVVICATTLWWTIVVLRDGRRSRSWHADVAQLVAHHLAKVRVAGSNPVIRSKGAVASTPAVEWPSGEATACKAVHTGSIPVSTSKRSPARLAQRESASLTRKRSLVQSQYRAPGFLQFSVFS